MMMNKRHDLLTKLLRIQDGHSIVSILISVAFQLSKFNNHNRSTLLFNNVVAYECMEEKIPHKIVTHGIFS